MKKIFIMFILMLGCICLNATPISQEEVKSAFDNAFSNKSLRSSWFDGRNQKLPLTIVKNAYVTPNALTLNEYKILEIILKKIEADPTLLDTYIKDKIPKNSIQKFFHSDVKLTELYSTVNVIDFEANQNNKQRFNAAYEKRLDKKDNLNKVLQYADIESNDTIGAEIAISIDYDEYQKGNLTLVGYKTIKETEKKRNSHIYTLRRLNYISLSERDKKEALIDGLIALLELSIPEYVPYNINSALNTSKDLKVFRKFDDSNYTGEIYKQTDLFSGLDATELLMTTAVPKNDIKYLINTGYLTENFDTSNISKEDGQKLADIFNLKFMNNLAQSVFPDIYADLYNIKKSNIDDILVLDHSKLIFDQNEMFFQTKISEKQVGIEKVFSNSKFTQDDLENGFAKASIDFLAKQNKPNLSSIENKVFTYDSNLIGKHSLYKINDKPMYQAGYEDLKYGYDNFQPVVSNCKKARAFLFTFNYADENYIENNCKSRFTTWSSNKSATYMAFDILLIQPVIFAVSLGGYNINFDFDREVYNEYVKDIHFNKNVFINEIN